MINVIFRSLSQVHRFKIVVVVVTILVLLIRFAVDFAFLLHSLLLVSNAVSSSTNKEQGE